MRLGRDKAMRAFAAIPPRRRSAHVRRAIGQGIDFLLDHDLSTGAFPTDTKVSRRWTQLAFPLGFVAVSLQGLEVAVELGRGRDPRLRPTVEMVLEKQDVQGRWRNEYPYRGKLWAEVDEPRRPSKWVRLRHTAAPCAAEQPPIDRMTIGLATTSYGSGGAIWRAKDSALTASVVSTWITLRMPTRHIVLGPEALTGIE